MPCSRLSRARLHQSIRPTDVVTPVDGSKPPNRGSVARLGGDEFVVLVTDLTQEGQATTVADRIRDALGEPFDCGGHRFVVTPSIGIALYPKDGSISKTCSSRRTWRCTRPRIRAATAMPSMARSMAIRSLSRLQLENDLRRAFDAGDFRIHHQPKVDLTTGPGHGCGGTAALAPCNPRLDFPGDFHPGGGGIRPDSCHGRLGASGDLPPLQRWAGTDLSHLTIAINVSVQQFAREDFVESVLRTLRHFDVRPQLLELEITESLLLRNVDDTTSCMKRFRAAGLTLSIDDFGTGYSSLGYLRSFPVDALKIDRSFVKDLNAKGDGGAICAAIIALARELKLRVIGRGRGEPRAGEVPAHSSLRSDAGFLDKRSATGRGAGKSAAARAPMAPRLYLGPPSGSAAIAAEPATAEPS